MPWPHFVKPFISHRDRWELSIPPSGWESGETTISITVGWPVCELGCSKHGILHLIPSWVHELCFFLVRERGPKSRPLPAYSISRNWREEPSWPEANSSHPQESQRGSRLTTTLINLSNEVSRNYFHHIPGQGNQPAQYKPQHKAPGRSSVMHSVHTMSQDKAEASQSG